MQTMCFLDTFLLFCLLKDSPKTNNVEYALIPQNIDLTVYQGRDPELKLLVGDSEILLREWGQLLFDEMRPVADLLDSAHQTNAYSQTFNVMMLKLTDDGTTPAAMLLEEMRANGETYYAMAMRKATEHRDYFQAKPPSAKTTAKYKQLAEESLRRQTEIEASDTLSFDDFLAGYYR